jgi:hypothetical protein
MFFFVLFYIKGWNVLVFNFIKNFLFILIFKYFNFSSADQMKIEIEELNHKYIFIFLDNLYRFFSLQTKNGFLKIKLIFILFILTFQ